MSDQSSATMTLNGTYELTLTITSSQTGLLCLTVMKSLARSGLVLMVALLALVPLHSQTQDKQLPEAPKPPVLKKSKPETKPREVDPDDVIRIDTTLVNSPVLVIGRDGKFVPNLKSEDFRIFEDGVEQEVKYFTTVDKPFTVALLIDTSRSTSVDLESIKSAAMSFVDRMRPNDRALVMTVSGQAKVLVQPTSDQNELKRAIGSCRPEGSTRIYDALSQVIDELQSVEGRSAVVLFSDGVDNDSKQMTGENVLERAERSQTLMYPVKFNTWDYAKQRKQTTELNLEGSGFSKEDYVKADSFLHQLASISGTGVYPAQNISDLDYAVSAIVDELHNEYSVGYYPGTPVDPKRERKVEVRISKPQLKVRARTSYSLQPSGEVTKVPGARRSVALTNDSPGALPSAVDREINKPSPETRWICKDINSPTDYVVVREAVVSRCPASARGDQTNAWFIRRPAEKDVMCKGYLLWEGKEVAAAPVPTGYVVTGEESSNQCSKSVSNDVNNAWAIQKPSSRIMVCKGFPLPRGFVTESEVESAGCPARNGKNALVIKPKS